MSASYKDVEHYRNFVEATKELRSVMDPVTSDKYWRDYFDYLALGQSFSVRLANLLADCDSFSAPEEPGNVDFCRMKGNPAHGGSATVGKRKV